MSTRRSVVKWFDAKKGYGFIVHPEGGADIFVHYSAIETDKRFKTLRTGQVVDFDLDDGPKGLHATNVIPTEEDDQPRDEMVPQDHIPSPDLHEQADSYGGDSSSAGSIQAAL